jgi:hypothetical protein
MLKSTCSFHRDVILKRIQCKWSLEASVEMRSLQCIHMFCFKSGPQTYTLHLTDPNTSVFLPILIFVLGPFLGEKTLFWFHGIFPIIEPYYWWLKTIPKNKNLFLGFTSFPKKELLFLGNSRFLPNRNRITRLYVHPTRFDY